MRVLNKYIIIILLIYSGLSVKAQSDSLPVRVSGIIHASDSSLKTPYVHIINKRTGRGVISDSVGIFRTKVLRTDTLIFKCIGFSDFMYSLPDSLSANVCLLNIKLTDTSYDLDVVDVIALSQRSQVRHDILSMEPDDGGWENQMITPGFLRGDYKWIKDDERMSRLHLFRPIKAIGYAMGKDVRDLSTLERLMEQDVKDVIIEKKYNRQILKDFTGYHVSKLDCFTMYLKLGEQFLLNESDYHILYKVKERMVPFELQYQQDSLAMLHDKLD